MGYLRSVNLASALVPHAAKDTPTGIRKRPADGEVEVREPTDDAGSGVVGDRIGDGRHHGGPDQALYAVAREVLDDWSIELGRALPDGSFGENLTTVGVRVDDAELGERWRLGGEVEVQVTSPRVPCGTFREHIAERGWLRRFTDDRRPGAYLRVITPGRIRAGDAVEIVHRPGHGITIADTFWAMMRAADELPGLLAAGPDLIPELREFAEQGRTIGG